MTTRTHEELAVAALPASLRERMATLVLRGVSFKWTGVQWYARNRHGYTLTGNTLFLLLNKMGWIPEWWVQ